MNENTTLHEIFDILTRKDNVTYLTEGGDLVQQYSHYILILACLIATFFLYNKQLAAIPLLLLSVILFYVAYKKVTKLKNKK